METTLTKTGKETTALALTHKQQKKKAKSKRKLIQRNIEVLDAPIPQTEKRTHETL